MSLGGKKIVQRSLCKSEHSIHVYIFRRENIFGNISNMEGINYTFFDYRFTQ